MDLFREQSFIKKKKKLFYEKQQKKVLDEIFTIKLFLRKLVYFI